MTPQRLGTVLILTASVGACSVARQAAGVGFVGSTYRPVAASTAWPAPAGNLATCGASGPAGDTPTLRSPADTIRMKSKTVRKVFYTLCSFTVPVSKINTGRLQQPKL